MNLAVSHIGLSGLASPEAIIPSLKAKSKRQALHKLSHLAAQLAGLPAREIFEKSLERERRGSTGLGRGTAIAHVELRSLKTIVCVFARLDQPIEFDALDGEPVDLIFLLLTPEQACSDYLKALARISRLLREPTTVQRLRTATDGAAIYAVLIGSAGPACAPGPLVPARLVAAGTRGSPMPFQGGGS
jgi:nitrogen PTS system EIIA component